MQSSIHQQQALPGAQPANPLSRRPQARPASGRSGRRGLQVVAAIKRGSDKTIVCSKTVVAKKGSEAAVQDLCQQVLDFSKQQMADRSNGILEFSVNHDFEDKNVFHFWERYTSNATMGQHNTQPEITKFMENVQQYMEQPVGMALYEMKNGQISSACIQGGPKGEGGLDDATGAGGGGGASMKQSSGAVDIGKQDRGEGDTAWGMGFKWPWQKKKDDKKKAKK
jgi:quinol monooxygenase YgiN